LDLDIELTDIPEGSPHDNSLVPKLLVVVVDLGDRLDARVLEGLEALLSPVGHVPVKDSTHERRNQRHTRLSTGHSLCEGKEERQVAVNPVLLLQNPRIQKKAHLFHKDCKTKETKTVLFLFSLKLSKYHHK
jgi:hypothetical protein